MIAGQELELRQKRSSIVSKGRLLTVQVSDDLALSMDVCFALAHVAPSHLH